MDSQIKIDFENFLNKENFSKSQIQLKKNNFNEFVKKGFPNKRIEDWKFSDLNQIIQTNIKKLNFISSDLKQEDFEITTIKDFEHNKIIFLNGKILKVDFSLEENDKIVIQQNHNINADHIENSLVSLNSAFVSDYVKFTVKKGYQAKKPLIFYNYLTTDIASSALNIRIDIDLEDGSSLNVVDLSNQNLNNNFINIRQNFHVGENAILKKYFLDTENSPNIKYIYNNLDLAKNSHLEYFILSSGSKFLKNDITCSLNNQYGSISLNGIINLDGEKHHEIKTVINHKDENCKSYQLIKSVLADQSKGVYQGKISVDNKAQKTDGYQLSRALLLNDQTEFNAKPELEIYADDVKCSHGSTSGNIDEDSIFYLMSRGLSYHQSKQLLVNAFLNEVLEKITDEKIKIFIKKLTGLTNEY